MAASEDSAAQGGLSHLDAKGQARMVDVSSKATTVRRALARGTVRLQPATLARVVAGTVSKGAVFEIARIAGIMAAKRTAEWIPLCHPLRLSAVRVDLVAAPPDRIEIEAEAVANEQTGVEMEAMVAVSAAALTVYDMLKGLEKGIEITAVRLEEKDGGKSGSFRRGGEVLP